MNKKGNVSIFLLMAVFLVVVAGMYLYLRRLENKAAPSPATRSQPIVEHSNVEQPKKWKWYTNNDFNFEFKYPAYLFPFEGNNGPQNQYWTSKKDWIGENGLSLNVTVSSPNHPRLEQYQKLISLKTGEKIPEMGVTRLNEGAKSGNTDIAGFYAQPIPGKPSEGAYTYGYVWIKDQRYFLIELTSTSKEVLEANRDIYVGLSAELRVMEKQDTPIPNEAKDWPEFSFTGYPVIIRYPKNLNVVETPEIYPGQKRVLKLTNGKNDLTVNVNRGAFGMEGNATFTQVPLMIDGQQVTLGRVLVNKTKITDNQNKSVSYQTLIDYPDHRDYKVIVFYQNVDVQTEHLFDLITSSLRFSY